MMPCYDFLLDRGCVNYPDWFEPSLAYPKYVKDLVEQILEHDYYEEDYGSAHDFQSYKNHFQKVFYSKQIGYYWLSEPAVLDSEFKVSFD